MGLQEKKWFKHRIVERKVYLVCQTETNDSNHPLNKDDHSHLLKMKKKNMLQKCYLVMLQSYLNTLAS